MTDSTRPHPRIERTEVPGRRVELKSLKGAVVFAGPKVRTDRPGPLIVHFHGAPWLIEYHVARELPTAVLVTVQLGAGSSAYARPFTSPDLLPMLLKEAGETLDIERGWSSVTLSGFSAGYGAVRAILRQRENYSRIDNVLLLDGIHASYSPDLKILAEGGTIATADLDSFVKFAADAAAGRKSFVITHSEIFPGTFASTTECTDLLLTTLNLRRKADLRQGRMGMQQLSSARREGFRVFGYAGNTAPDHIDHLHAMPAWFRFLRID
jgi:hypothetical protein